MRIIAGKFKGRKIEFISNDKTRPTADIVREALFDKIQFQITDCIFLDLFSGSGAIGFEALSRGAKEVFFVEKDRKNFEIIKNNLKVLCGKDYEKTLQKQNQKIHLINSDFLVFLDKIKVEASQKVKSGDASFDFVYIDPPYKSEFYNIALQQLRKNNLITDESLVICEHEKLFPFIHDDILKDYELIAQKKYGSKMLSYFKLL